VTQQTKFIVRYVGIHVIIVNVFQVDTILFEQDQQVRVVTYQMFRYLRVRLTEIEAVNIRMPRHQRKKEFGRASVAVVGKRKIADFVDRRK